MAIILIHELKLGEERIMRGLVGSRIFSFPFLEDKSQSENYKSAADMIIHSMNVEAKDAREINYGLGTPNKLPDGMGLSGVVYFVERTKRQAAC